MAWTSVNPVVVGYATQKPHYDAVFENTIWLDGIFKGTNVLGAHWQVNGQSFGIGGAPANLFHVYGTSASSTATEGIFEGRFGGFGAGFELSSRTSSGGTLVAMAKIVASGTAAWDTTAANQDAQIAMYAALNGTLTESMRVYPEGINILGGLGVGFSIAAGSVADDVIAIGDANFNLNFGAGNPRLLFDSTDQILYTRSTNSLTFEIASTVEMTLNASGLQVTDGLVVGFSGTPVADTVAVGDADFRLSLNGFDAAIEFDVAGTSKLNFDRFDDEFEFHRGGSIKMIIGAGVRTLNGGFSIGTTNFTTDAMRLKEISEPANPAANEGVFFLKDNGSGKTQACVRFASGATQVYATEP